MNNIKFFAIFSLVLFSMQAVHAPHAKGFNPAPFKVQNLPHVTIVPLGTIRHLVVPWKHKKPGYYKTFEDGRNGVRWVTCDVHGNRVP